MINSIQKWLSQRPIYLYYFIFITGFSILVIEFAAVSFLEPYCGKHNIIWALIISLVMMALCLGYILGGKYADKYQHIHGLYYLLTLSGLYVMILPFFGKWIVHQYFYLVVDYMDPSMMMFSGSFILTILLFGPPLVILAMAEPYIIKWYSKNLEDAGTRVGEMFSFATIGGLLGLYATSLFLIPVFGSPMTLSIIGSLLFLSATWMFKKKKSHFFIIATLCLAYTSIVSQQPITGEKNLFISLMHSKF